MLLEGTVSSFGLIFVHEKHAPVDCTRGSDGYQSLGWTGSAPGFGCRPEDTKLLKKFELRYKRTKDLPCDPVAGGQLQAGTKLPSADDGTTRPTVHADMPQADSGTDLSGGQLQAGTEPPSVEAGPLLEVTNTLGTRPSKRKRSPSKRNRSQTMRHK